MNVCSFSSLTYSQWLNNTILANPLDDQTVTSEGYVLNYGKYATGWITPEYGYWKNMNKKQALAEAEYL